MHSRARRISSRPSCSSSFIQGVCAIADDTIAIARRVAGVAACELLYREVARAREMQQPVDRYGAAGLVAAQSRLALQDHFARARIQLLCLRIREIVTQVGARENDRVVALRDAFENQRNIARGRLTCNERQERDLIEENLQKGKLHFETMLESMRLIRFDDVRDPFER